MLKVILAYGSALSRIDDMKLFGGVSGGRTGTEILGTFSDINEHGLPQADLGEGGGGDLAPSTFALRAMTNSWCLPSKNSYHTVDENGQGRIGVPRYTFRTWDEYRELLYDQCESWDPDIVLCAPAVSNYTPTYVIEEPYEGVGKLVSHTPRVQGKVDSRNTEKLLIRLRKTPNILGGVRQHIGRNAVLVGFKLTSHGDLDQLIEHARYVMQESQADLVVANDIKLGLGRKFFVTPTGWWEGETKDIALAATGIAANKQRGFYRSIFQVDVGPDNKDLKVGTPEADKAYTTAKDLWSRLHLTMPEHGCLAVRLPPEGFVTTTRGKSGRDTNVPYTEMVSGPGCPAPGV